LSAAARASSQVNLKVESIGLVSKLFRVEDAYQANLNQDGCAESTMLYSQEGNRQRETRVTYDGHKAATWSATAPKTPCCWPRTSKSSCVHDVAGGLYFLRTLNLERATVSTWP